MSEINDLRDEIMLYCGLYDTDEYLKVKEEKRKIDEEWKKMTFWQKIREIIGAIK